MNLDIQSLVLLLISILIAISVHETMHALVARLLGDNHAEESGRISLNPIRHIDPFLTVVLPLMMFVVGGPLVGAAKPVPFRPSHIKWGEIGVALMAIAGPLSNLIMAIIGGVVLKSVSIGIIENFALLFVYINVGFFTINILPIPPLDGSRVFYAVAPDAVRKIMNAIESLGLVVFVVLMIFGLDQLRPILDRISDFALNLVF